MLERRQKTLRALWHASVASLIVYLAVPVVIPFSGPQAAKLPLPIRPVLWVIALVECGVVVWWRRNYLERDRLSALADKYGDAQLVGHFVGKSVSGFAMAASIAAYGLVLALVGRYFWDQYILTILSFLCLIYVYPSKDCFDEINRRLPPREVKR